MDQFSPHTDTVKVLLEAAKRRQEKEKTQWEKEIAQCYEQEQQSRLKRPGVRRVTISREQIIAILTEKLGRQRIYTGFDALMLPAGQIIRNAIQDAGVSIKEVCKAVGCSKDAFRKHIVESHLTLEEVQIIAETLATHRRQKGASR